MPAANITRNHKRFTKEMLDTENNEYIIGGSADGKVQIVYGYDDYFNGEKKKSLKEFHMTLFPTNKRIVVYQTSSFIFKDKMEELPLSEIKQITFCEYKGEKRTACITEFITSNDSKYPSIIFNLDCTGHPDDLEQYKIILRGLSRLSQVSIENFTKINEE